MFNLIKFSVIQNFKTSAKLIVLKLKLKGTSLLGIHATDIRMCVACGAHFIAHTTVHACVTNHPKEGLLTWCFVLPASFCANKVVHSWVPRILELDGGREGRDRAVLIVFILASSCPEKGKVMMSYGGLKIKKCYNFPQF